MRAFRTATTVLLAAACLFFGAATMAEAQTRACTIASNDDSNGFRTDQVTRCRINTSNGKASFVFEGKRRKRSYDSAQPLTTRHLDAARYWLNRTSELSLPTGTNPAGFNMKMFLSEAANATHGFVLVRNRKSGPALNVVYITNGVYRSIDFPGTNLRETPSGFLTTRR